MDACQNISLQYYASERREGRFLKTILSKKSWICHQSKASNGVPAFVHLDSATLKQYLVIFVFEQLGSPQ